MLHVWTSGGQIQVTWLHRGETGGPTGHLLLHTLREVEPMDDGGRVWLACEASAMRRLRRQLLDGWQLPSEHVVTRGYWKVGEPNCPDHDYGHD